MPFALTELLLLLLLLRHGQKFLRVGVTHFSRLEKPFHCVPLVRRAGDKRKTLRNLARVVRDPCSRNFNVTKENRRAYLAIVLANRKECERFTTDGKSKRKRGMEGDVASILETSKETPNLPPPRPRLSILLWQERRDSDRHVPTYKRTFQFLRSKKRPVAILFR